MTELLFAPAFTLWGAPTTWLEVAAVILSVLCVGCNVREIHWGWPLGIAGSVLYFALFWRSKLYGDASLQVFFAVISLWGWAAWLRGRRADGSQLKPARLTLHEAAVALLASALLWPLTALFLRHFTDTDVPWWDGFCTALSVVAQVLLGRKFIENWLVWIVVDGVSIALFAYKALWLTTGLYMVFVMLCIAGWRAWARRL